MEAPRSSEEGKVIPISEDVRRLTTKEIVELLEVEDFSEVEPGQNLGVFYPVNTLR